MLRKETYDEGVDVWCLGVLMYEFLIGRPPFETANASETYKKILRSKPNYPDTLSDEAKDLMEQLLQKDPEKRITLAEVPKHPWIVKYAGNCSDF